MDGRKYSIFHRRYLCTFPEHRTNVIFFRGNFSNFHFTFPKTNFLKRYFEVFFIKEENEKNFKWKKITEQTIKLFISIMESNTIQNYSNVSIPFNVNVN